MKHRHELRNSIMDCFREALRSTGNANVIVSRTPTENEDEQVVLLSGRGGTLSTLTWSAGVANERDECQVGFQLLTDRSGFTAAEAEQRWYDLVDVMQRQSGLWPSKALAGDDATWVAVVGDVRIEDPDVDERSDGTGAWAHGVFWFDITVDLTRPVS